MNATSMLKELFCSPMNGFYKLYLFAYLLFGLSGIGLAQVEEANKMGVSVSIDHADGGNSAKWHMDDLLRALNEEGCAAVKPSASTGNPAQLHYDSRPVSIARKERTDYRLIAQARTLEGQLTVRGAILVHAARGITELESLRGEWVSFVSKESWSGYRLPVKLLNEAGVKDSGDSFNFIGNHVGSISALLHKDVHVAVLAEPLAKRWADANGLSIVAVTDEVETAGWWMHRTVSDVMTRKCTQALSKLTRSQHKALPAWIDGFVIKGRS